MQETLGVAPLRGFLRFVPTKEENLASNGRTMAGEIDELERAYFTPAMGPLATVTNEATGAAPRRIPVRQMLSIRVSAATSLRFPLNIPGLTH